MDTAELRPVHGRIGPPTYETRCGQCGEHTVSVQAATQPQAEEFLHLHGWRYVDGIGWICWECQDD